MPYSRFITTVLLVGEFFGLITFVVMYAQRSNWRSNYVGRTLMAWPAAMLVLIVASVLVRVWPGAVMSWILAVAHGVFAFAVWHRVRVLHLYLRNSETEETPDEDGTQSGDGEWGRSVGGRPDRPQDRGAPH
jgi:hypothetical protein